MVRTFHCKRCEVIQSNRNKRSFQQEELSGEWSKVEQLLRWLFEKFATITYLDDL